MQINVYIVQKHNYAENKYTGEKFFLLMTKKKKNANTCSERHFTSSAAIS